MVAASFIVITSIEVILYSFHLSVLILLISKRKFKFNGAFYNIFRVVLAADLISFVSISVAQKISLLPFVKNIFVDSDYIASYNLNVSSFMGVVQFLGHTLMAFNRFTLIWFPLKQDRLWKRQWYIPFLLVVPCLHISWKIHQPAKYFYSVSDDSVVFKFLSPTIASLNYTFLTAIYFVATLFAAFFNLITFYKIIFYKQTSANLNVNERNLLYVSFIIFLAQLLRITFPLSQLLFPNDAALTAFSQAALPIMNDIFAFSGSISMMFLSATTRKEYIAFFTCIKLVNSSLTFTHVKMYQSQTQQSTALRF